MGRGVKGKGREKGGRGGKRGGRGGKREGPPCSQPPLLKNPGYGPGSHGRCPKNFGDVYTPVHTVAARSRLRSADHGDIVVPRARSARFDCRSFRVCGPTI